MTVRRGTAADLPRHLRHWLLHGELDPDRHDGFGSGALACFTNGPADWRRLWRLHGPALKREHPGRAWAARFESNTEEDTI